MRLSGFDSPGSLREMEKEFAELPSPAAARLALREEMLKGVRSWGTGSIIVGLFSLVGHDVLAAPWGVVLVLVGLGSRVCKAGSMYVVYGVVLAWAGISNLFSGTWYWIALAALQAYWAFRAFRDFARFREAGLVGAHGSQGAEDLHDLRAQRFFPWASLALGTAWLPILMVVFLGEIVHVVLYPEAGHGPFPAPLMFLLALGLDAGVLGISFGVASLLARYRLRGLAIAGIAAGSLVTLINLLFGLLA